MSGQVFFAGLRGVFYFFTNPPKTFFLHIQHMAVAQNTGIPKWDPGGPKPAVCPSCLILSHSHIQGQSAPLLFPSESGVVSQALSRSAVIDGEIQKRLRAKGGIRQGHDPVPMSAIKPTISLGPPVEVGIGVPFFSVVYVSRGTLPQKRVKGHYWET